MSHGCSVEQGLCLVSIDCNVGFEGFVFVSRWSYMVGCIGNFDGMVGFFLGMPGTARFSSSFSSSSSSISSLVVPLMMILGSWLLVTIAGEVSYISTVVTCTFPFASFFFMGW